MFLGSQTQEVGKSGETTSVIVAGEEGTECQPLESDPGLSLVGNCFICEKDSASPAVFILCAQFHWFPPGLVRLLVRIAELGWGGKKAFGSVTQPDSRLVT